MDSYEQYEKECKRIRKENKKIISEFRESLSDRRLSQKTMEKHCSNVNFYINEFLLYEDAIEAANGVNEVGMFLGYWFIKKAMWANTTAIKENAASLKKFYQFMFERDKISEDSLRELKERIKEDMPEWLDTMDRYDDPDIEDMEEVWEF